MIDLVLPVLVVFCAGFVAGSIFTAIVASQPDEEESPEPRSQSCDLS